MFLFKKAETFVIVLSLYCMTQNTQTYQKYFSIPTAGNMTGNGITVDRDIKDLHVSPKSLSQSK